MLKFDTIPKQIWLIFVLIFVYLIILNNLLVSLLYVTPSQETQSPEINSNVIKLNFGNTVSVGITRVRWYGETKISESDKIFKPFNLFDIPLKRNGYNLFLIHLLFVVGLVFLLIKLKGGRDEKLG